MDNPEEFEQCITISNNSLVILHFNMRSLKHSEHFNDLILLLTVINVTPDFIVIAGSWLDNCDTDYVTIPG